jgi:hypothetical protein
MSTMMGIETMEIQGYPKWQRVYAVCVFGVVGIFFAWLYWNNRSSEGSWFGLIMIALCFWQASYWVCLPKVLGVLTPEGMDYINEDLGFLFYYPWFHIDWDQVTDIHTFEETDKNPPVMVTVLRATDKKNSGKVHAFRIYSTNMDYYRVLAYIKAVVNPAAFKKTDSLPLEPALLRKKLQGDMRHKLASLLITSLILLIFAYFTRR